jgi:hypothetical protein
MTRAAAVTGIPISQLPDADLPLTGAEIVPLVQSGVTKQVPVLDLAGTTPGSVVWTGTATSALAAGANNNLLVDISAAARLGLTPADSTSELRGLQGGVDGKMLMIVNLSTVETLTVIVESGTSDAANRFAINGDLVVPPRCGALFMYEGTLDRWVKA